MSPRRSRGRDAGSSLIEISVAMAIGMIALSVGGTLLVTASEQEQAVSGTAATVDTARTALDDLVNELREARSLRVEAGDARAWFDRDRDGLEDVGEVVRFGYRSDGDDQQLVRVVDGVTMPIARGVTGGSFAVAVVENGTRLTASISVPGVHGRTGTTLTSEVTSRGNV